MNTSLSCCRNVKQVLITILLLAIFVGFLLGFVVHRCYMAFSDVAADDARTRFQALYADPTTEIEDLPTNFPAGYASEFFPESAMYIILSPVAFLTFT